MASTDDYFAEDDAPPPSHAPTTPTGNASGGANVITFEVAPTPAGLLRSYIKQARTLPSKPMTVIVEVQPDEGPFASGEHVTAWFDLTKNGDMVRFKTWAGVLGIPVEDNGRGRFSVDLSAFAKKPCRALYVPWHKQDGSVEAQIAKWAPSPDPSHKGFSKEFDTWAKSNNFSYDTLAGTSGIMPLT